ncbi:MAG TPA: hypothetical protein VFD58_11670 [Blastocatellia bacterium]|nr:hypothetical protein [Blastocatellia bacterium]
MNSPVTLVIFAVTLLAFFAVLLGWYLRRNRRDREELEAELNQEARYEDPRHRS